MLGSRYKENGGQIHLHGRPHGSIVVHVEGAAASAIGMNRPRSVAVNLIGRTRPPLCSVLARISVQINTILLREGPELLRFDLLPGDSLGDVLGADDRLLLFGDRLGQGNHFLLQGASRILIGLSPLRHIGRVVGIITVVLAVASCIFKRPVAPRAERDISEIIVYRKQGNDGRIIAFVGLLADHPPFMPRKGQPAFVDL